MKQALIVLFMFVVQGLEAQTNLEFRLADWNPQWESCYPFPHWDVQLHPHGTEMLNSYCLCLGDERKGSEIRIPLSQLVEHGISIGLSDFPHTEISPVSRTKAKGVRVGVVSDGNVKPIERSLIVECGAWQWRKNIRFEKNTEMRHIFFWPRIARIPMNEGIKIFQFNNAKANAFPQYQERSKPLMAGIEKKGTASYETEGVESGFLWCSLSNCNRYHGYIPKEFKFPSVDDFPDIFIPIPVAETIEHYLAGNDRCRLFKPYLSAKLLNVPSLSETDAQERLDKRQRILSDHLRPFMILDNSFHAKTFKKLPTRSELKAAKSLYDLYQELISDSTDPKLAATILQDRQKIIEQITQRKQKDSDD